MKPLSNPPHLPKKYSTCVIVECCYCGSSDAIDLDLPLSYEDSLQCPECGQYTRLDLAIIQYLDESE